MEHENMNSIEQNLTKVSMEGTTKELLSSTLREQTGTSPFFDRGDTLRLIESVRKKPKLWHRQFIRKRLSSGVSEWEDIQRNEFPSRTVDQLKARWKTMRDSFRRESRRIECGEFTKSRWPLYDDMLFLEGHFRLRKTLLHKAPAPFAKQHAKSTRSKESVAVHPKKVLACDRSKSCTLEKGTDHHNKREHQQLAACLTNVDANDAPVAISEVTFSNKFRSRVKSDPVSEGTQEGGYTQGQQITNGQFLMSLVPFFNMLPLDKNLETRLKVLQVIANASQSVDV